MIVGYRESEFGMGHGHANALVGWTLAGNVAPTPQGLRGDSPSGR
jgi:hypothetical protein